MLLSLRDYQNEAVAYLLQRIQHQSRLGLVVIPTGGGKSAVLKCALKLAMERGFLKGALIITPRTHIVEQFVDADDYIYEDPAGVTHRVVFTPQSVVIPKKGCGAKNADMFRSYMANPAGRILVATHSQFIHWCELTPKSTTGFGLVVDEGHRKGHESTRIFELASRWWSGGGILLSGTATPFRTDENMLLPETLDEVYTTPYSRLLATWDFPEIELRIHALNPGTTRPPDGFNDADARVIAEYIRASDRETVIHIPRGSKKRGAVDTAARLIKALRAVGYTPSTLLDGTGEGNEISCKVLRRLSDERHILKVGGYMARTLHVVISCERLLEGADWPACSQVITIGQSTSPGREAQKLGRGLRPKNNIKDFPPAFAANTIYTVFIDELDSQDVRGRQRQAAATLAMASFLEASDAALDYSRYFENLVIGFRLPPVVRQHLTSTPMDPDVAAAKQDFFTEAALLQVSLGRFPTLGEVVEAIRNNMKLTPTDKLYIVREAMIASSSVSAELKKDLRTLLNDYVRGLRQTQSNLKPSSAYKDLFWEALMGLAQKHEAHLIDIRTHPIAGDSFYARLGEADLRNLVREMVDARDAISNLSDDETLRVMDEYNTRYGVFPVMGVGPQDISEIVDYRLTVGDLERRLQRTGMSLALLQRARVWHGMSAVPVAQYKQRMVGRHIPNIQVKDHLSVTGILQALRDPKMQAAARVLGVPGENWLGLVISAWRGWRGLPTGMDLQTILR